MRTQHSLVWNRNTQNPDTGQLLWGVGANRRARLRSASDTSEHGTQGKLPPRNSGWNTTADESWHNTGGSGGVTLLPSAGSHRNDPHLRTADLGNRGCCPFNERKHHLKLSIIVLYLCVKWSKMMAPVYVLSFQLPAWYCTVVQLNSSKGSLSRFYSWI